MEGFNKDTSDAYTRFLTRWMLVASILLNILTSCNSEKGFLCKIAEARDPYAHDWCTECVAQAHVYYQVVAAPNARLWV
jgi:hypothetical protein